MTMSSNVNCTHGNFSMGQCGTLPNSSVGLSVGLTILFLLLGAGLVALLYTQRQRLRDLLGRDRTSDPEHPCTPEEEGYRGLDTQPPPAADHNPIYQNVTAADRRHMALGMNRSPSEREEELYLQCDALDDAIYSNDPSCSLTMLPPRGHGEEEDLYIVPDAL